jgi:hypothetical protein
MSEKNEIRSLEMVRRIRDEMAIVLEGKSHAEIIAFFQKAGDIARQEASRPKETTCQRDLRSRHPHAPDSQ